MDNQLLRFMRFACTSMAVARGWAPFRSTKYALTYSAAGLFAALLLRER
jgi:hypothetical protein